MANLKDSIKNSFSSLITIVKNELNKKATLNEQNTFSEDIRFNKKIILRDENNNEYDCGNTLLKASRQSHSHSNNDNINRIGDVLNDNGQRVLTYNNIQYQEKYPFPLDSELLSKFNIENGALSFDGTLVIDPDSKKQSNFTKTETFDVESDLNIKFQEIVDQNSISTIVKSEFKVKNKSDNDVEITVKQAGTLIDYSLLIPAGESHVYDVGINKGTIIQCFGKIDYSLSINYF